MHQEDDTTLLAAPRMAKGDLRRLQLCAPVTLRARIALELALHPRA